MQRAGRIAVGLALLFATVAVTTVARPADAAETYAYVAGTTAVARTGGSTVADSGTVVCAGAPDADAGAGVGGVCIPWSAGGSAIEVVDGALGHDVAFQACVDNDGNLQCGGTPVISGCADAVVFSHFDNGTFSNPLAAPTSFTSGCPGGFPGWVVFLCQGAHDAGGLHAHEATGGTVTTVASGGPSGQFCGSPPVLPGKPYYGYLPTGVENVCTGEGTLTTPPLHFPGLGPAATGTFSATFDLGACVTGTVTLSGTITGPAGGAYCNLATGAGTVAGHRFTFLLTGGLFQITPVTPEGAAGLLSLVADPTTTPPQSCVNGATKFLFAGSVILS